jgi:hypothetical protein
MIVSQDALTLDRKGCFFSMQVIILRLSMGSVEKWVQNVICGVLKITLFKIKKIKEIIP